MEIVDRHWLVYWVGYFLGFSHLLPWNIVITVSGYWNFKFRNVSLDHVHHNSSETIQGDAGLTDLQKEYNSYVAIATNVPCAIMIILHAAFGHKTGLKLRIFGSQAMDILGLLSLAILTFVNSDTWQREFLWLNLAIIIVINIFQPVFQGALASLYGMFPPEYVGKMGAGAGMGGILPSLLAIVVIKISEGETNNDSGTSTFLAVGSVCFFMATLVAFAALVAAYLVMFKNSYFMHVFNAFRMERSSQEHEGDLKLAKGGSSDKEMFLHILRKAGVFLLVILVNFSSTLVAFPSLTALVESTSSDAGSDWKRLYFVPVCCFLLYNVMDYAGKEVATLVQWPQPSRCGKVILLTMAVLRTAFIPLFMFCNLAPENRHTEVLFASDAWYIAFIILFAFSNGYVGNIALMWCPRVVDLQYKGTACSMGIACLVTGCALGSVISYGVVSLL